MSAYFSRVRFADRNQNAAELQNSVDVSDATTGNYSLNTTFGNRPRRVAIGTLRSANPAWRGGEAEPVSGDWRAMFASRITSDRGRLESKGINPKSLSVSLRACKIKLKLSK